jgi:hypothetical protein
MRDPRSSRGAILLAFAAAVASQPVCSQRADHIHAETDRSMNSSHRGDKRHAATSAAKMSLAF